MRNVKIKRNEIQSLTQLTNRIIEIGLFAKSDFTGYYNNVRANLRIFSSGFTAFIVLAIGFVIYMETMTFIEVDWWPSENPQTLIAGAIVSFFTLWTALFWNEKVSIHKKWEYLANLYNEILKTEPAISKPEIGYLPYQKRDLLVNALALDILQMEMWSHESYADLFYDSLEEAIRSIHDENHASFICSKLPTSGIYRSDAKQYLLDHQQIILKYSTTKSAA